ncbi:hypothetical protein ACSZNX_10985 [Aeromonas veronii]|uniref:hypothetical protein n=1 Tax=Aeromonas veronii TaxID=654 RepID=UPI003EC902B2
MNTNSGLINYSRAGDIFHYRWAVKRCLHLLDFNTDLEYLTIEGSEEHSLSGECVIDLAEYRRTLECDLNVEYFQLKHSTVRVDDPFTLSKLKDTIEGFSKRFIELNSSEQKFAEVKFTVITNRIISPTLKCNIAKISSGNIPSGKFIATLEKYTNLKGNELIRFCKCLQFCDSEGNYNQQKYDIHKELHRLSVSKNVFEREKLLVAKVWEKIEPGKTNNITREDMLEAFDVISFDDFFPAPPLFEPISHYIARSEQSNIAKSIKNATTHTIITANGGVGKSILSSNISAEFNEPSIVVAYDCFGNGSYRRTSAKRHEVKYALSQIINTLAKDSLCDQIIPSRNEPDEYWIKVFLNRIRDACSVLSSQDEEALLVLIFDAADNAEMAAEEQGGTCFANQLLKEIVPNNCRLVFTCRPERLDLLDPPYSINKIELSSFSNEETLENLKSKYADATIEQATEFNRLTGGNPRVQSNAMSLQMPSLDHLLLSFNSRLLTVEDLIERQLEESIVRIKNDFPINYRESIDNICTGLAVLPPFVPIAVLAKAANVSVDSVKSFIADLGHPLWKIDDTVQFRDEPTEKWFQDNYIATPDKIYNFVNSIKPLSNEFSYVSESLPLLLLKSEQLDELVELALSDRFLPSISVFDDKQVKVQRLQYAFKAALKNNKICDAIKLALIAGEEIAGNDRQLDILANNIDLASLFLSSSRMQELAHRKEIRGNWDGSETIFSASLLSTVAGFSGEAYSYYRSAIHWLNRYFERRDEAKENEDRFNEKLEDIEILELAFVVYRVKGWRECVDFLLSWNPSSCIYNVTSKFIERLVDANNFEKIAEMANYGKNDPSFILAITSELSKVGKVPPRNSLVRCLNKIVNPCSRLEKPSDYFQNDGAKISSYLSFFEACLIHQLPKYNIRKGINYYFDFPMLYRISDAYQYDGARESLLRYLSICAVLENNFDLLFENYVPKKWLDGKNNRENKNELDRAKAFVEKLLPWYIVRAKILSGLTLSLNEEHKLAAKLSSKVGHAYYREDDPIPYEISKIRFENILLCKEGYTEELDDFIHAYRHDDVKISLVDNLYILRACCRNDKLYELSDLIEQECCVSLKNYDYDESPESRAEQFIKLSRAVLSVSQRDAAYYFDEALNKASGFGEEGVIRWEALSAIAKRISTSGCGNPELAHRYMRCAEMIGDSVTKEKHWDRYDAISTCFQLSPALTFAILSRWKDRGVSWHERHIVALANSAINSNLTSPASLWSLSCFSWDHGRYDFLKKCLEKETSKINQQRMLNSYVKGLRTQGYLGDKWRRIYDLASQFNLECLNKEIDRLIELSSKSNESGSVLVGNGKEAEFENEHWEDLYGQFELLTDIGFKSAFEYYISQPYPKKSSMFWMWCYQKVTSRSASSFLEIISQCEILDFYDLREAFEQVPSAWRKKVSLGNCWNNMVYYIASRYPTKFTTIYERRYLINAFIFNESTHEYIKNGVINGLSSSVDIESASALFGFVHYSAKELNEEDALTLIDFGLSRLELYIESDYADGCWNDCIKVSESIPHALVSYIYANLGSPHAEERWRAVHAVLELYTLNCQQEIKLLIDLYDSGLLPSYVPKGYVFYDLHAKLYLLVALTRCASEEPIKLIGYSHYFYATACNKDQGLLIQFYAKQICLYLYRAKEAVFSEDEVEQLYRACLPQYHSIEENKYLHRIDSPWHENGELGLLPKLSFSYDFDRYWFEPLGRIFGISGEQVEDLAKHVLFNGWKLKFNSSHIPDSRASLWRRYRLGSDTFSSHGSYPRVDGYGFYISYHLLFEVASILLARMPVIEHQGCDISCWDEWLEKHLILNKNHMLLAELRDPIPITRPSWFQEKYSEVWPWQVVETDFIDNLVSVDGLTMWLNVEGGWDEYRDGKNEHVSFSSVLVPKGLGPALLHTTLSIEDYIDGGDLYNFCEFYDRDNSGFHCEEWLFSSGRDNDIESKDPYAGAISARPYKLRKCITNIIDVSYSEDEKKCMLLSDDSVCLDNIFWSENRPSDRDSYFSSGSYVKVSLDFLKMICNKMNVDIALQVYIKRTFKGAYKNENNEVGYIPGYCKTFILSGDGKIRDAGKSYQLG